LQAELALQKAFGGKAVANFRFEEGN
jgi:hypothetical protein